MKQYWSRLSIRKEKERNSRNIMLRRKETLEKLRNSVEDAGEQVEALSQSMDLTTVDSVSVKLQKN